MMNKTTIPLALGAFAVVAFIGLAMAQGPYGRYEGSIPQYPNQTMNEVFASPDGVDGSPVFRAIVAGDLPAGLINAVAQAKNLFYAGPASGGNAAPGFRAMSSLDFPAAAGNVLPTSTTGALTTGSTNYSGVVTGASAGGTTSTDVIFAGGGFANYAFCTVTAASSGAKGLAPYISASAKTGFTITYTAGASAAWNYVCQGS